jgi:hypothetical protein
LSHPSPLSTYALDSVVILQIEPTHILAGFPGDVRPQYSSYLDGELWLNHTASMDMKELQTRLRDILRRVFFRELLISPKSQTMLVLEDPFLPLPVKKLLTHVLVVEFHVPSVVFQPLSVCTLIAAGTAHGLVIDLGWDEARIMPVFDFRELTPYARCTIRGTKMLYERLSARMSENGTTLSCTKLEKLLLSEDDKSNTIQDYRQIFLEGDKFDDDNDMCIPDLVNKVISDLDINLRGAVRSSVVVMGRCVSFWPELTDAIAQRVGGRLRTSSGAWTGASIYLSSNS